MQKRLMLVISFALLVASSCNSRRDAAMKEEMWKLKNRMKKLEVRVNQRESKFAYLAKASDEARKLLEESKENREQAHAAQEFQKNEIQAVRTRLDSEVMPRISSAEKELLDLNSRISGESRGRRAKKPKTKRRPKPSTKSTSPKQVFQQAKKLFKQRKYGQVISTLNRFENNNKSFKGLEQVVYVRAESRYMSKDYANAALDFNYILEKYKKSAYAPAAQMRMGDCYRTLGENDTALIYYEEFLSRFKKSRYKKEVRTKIARLKKGK